MKLWEILWSVKKETFCINGSQKFPLKPNCLYLLKIWQNFSIIKWTWIKIWKILLKKDSYATKIFSAWLMRSGTNYKKFLMNLVISLKEWNQYVNQLIHKYLVYRDFTVQVIPIPIIKISKILMISSIKQL